MDHLDFREEDFANFPEPPELPKGPSRLEESYYEGLDAFISEIGQHIRTIQSEEGQRMSKYAEKMAKLKEEMAEMKNAKLEEKIEEEERLRRVYNSGINAIRRRRKEFRKILKDALDERQKYLDSKTQQKEEQELIRQKLVKLKEPHKTQPEAGEKTVFDVLSAAILFFQFIMMLVYQVTIIYSSDTTQNQTGGKYRADDYYSYLIHISLLVTFGYGFLLSFIRKFTFSAVGFNFVLVAFVTQFALLTNLLFSNISVRSNDWQTLDLSIPDIIRALYAATAVSISYGVVCGKIRFSELVVFCLAETFFYSLNHYVAVLKVGGVDPGGAMTIHVFGAFFGLAASFWLSKPFAPNQLRLHEVDGTSSYHSHVTTLIGTIFVWCLIPSFNAALAPDGSQHRVTVNTFVSMVGGTVMAFFVSSALRRKKFHILDVQYATLAAGIAMGSGHSALIVPGGALLVGAVAGFMSVLFYSFFFQWFESKLPFKVYDTRGVQGLHALPGFIGALASIIALSRNRAAVFGQPGTDIFTQGLPSQGGYQAGCLAVSVGIGLGGGFATGLIIWFLRRLSRTPHPPVYNDEFDWQVPSDYLKLPHAGGIPEP